MFTLLTVKYSSVPNRRVGQNKRAGGKILKKTLNVQTQVRPCRGDFFVKINKRAGQLAIKINVQGEFSLKNNKHADPNKAVQGGIFF